MFGGEPTICIVGGAGHVGLPLALVLASKGHSVRIYDLNREVLKRIQDGEMPFAEADAEPLLRQALDANRLSFSSSADSIADVPTVIVTIGTPVDEFMNPETRVIKQWADESLPYLSPGQLLVFRSTIYPGTTQWLESYLTRQGKKMCCWPIAPSGSCRDSPFGSCKLCRRSSAARRRRRRTRRRPSFRRSRRRSCGWRRWRRSSPSCSRTPIATSSSRSPTSST